MTDAQTRQRHTGLTREQVEQSRREHGDNVLTPPPRDPWWKLYLEKFDDPVIRILLIAAVIAIGVGAAHGDYIEGVGIVVAILLATSLAFVNEYKAAREFDILNRSEDDRPVKVIRDGNSTEIPRRDVVVGDVVIVEAGEKVPADGVILESVALQADEASLTGEPLPFSKFPHGSAEAAAITNRTLPADQLFRGTTVVDGHGLMRVTAVGNRTKVGAVVVQSSEETDEVTPLNAQLERLSKLIGVVGFGVAAATFTALVVRGAITGELAMSRPQWMFSGVLLAAALVAMTKVWLPIAYDLREFLGWHGERPRWLEAEGFALWFWTAVAGVALFAVGLAALWATGLLAAEPGQWLPPEAGQALLRFFMIAVTIIVVAVPEGLAMSVTLSLAYSMRRMQASNTMVRRMHACETIGAATVICSDKTGTLTTSKMRVQEVHVPALTQWPGTSDDAPPAAELLAEAIAANSTALLDRTADGEPAPLGNPTEGALLLWLEARGFDYMRLRDGFRTHDQLTFSTKHKYMATLGQSAVAGGRLLHVKGAPEVLLAGCATILTPAGPMPIDDERPAIEAALRGCQARGMRTLGFAFREIGDDAAALTLAELTHGMTWLGFVAIADPLRPEVPQAVRDCQSAGIDVKIITGDNSETAREIGRQIGLLGDHDAPDAHLSGQAFGDLSEPEALEACDRIKILSRVLPEQKKRMVELLQQRGHVVAVTGDGINDGPALNHANVGLAMGRTGTSVAREASDMILLDDSFKSVVSGVIWGRSLYQNIQRFILFQLTINVTALVIALLGPFIGVALPLTVIQMLWINLIMDTFAALALASEPADPDVMRRPPRRSADFIVTPHMARVILGVAAVFVVLLVAHLLYIRSDGEVTTYERSVFYTTFVMLQFWNLFNARRLGSSKSSFSELSQNRLFFAIAVAILLGQVVITQFAWKFFQTVPMTLRDWLLILTLTSPVMLVGELWRWWRRRSEAAGAPGVAG